jgi:hypothetical protein
MSCGSVSRENRRSGGFGVWQAGYFKGHFHEQDHGVLSVEIVDGVPEVTLPLAVTDYLLVD